MASTWAASIRSGLGNVANFAGRDRPGMFWPYAGTMVAGAFAIWYVFGALVMRRMIRASADGGGEVFFGFHLMTLMTIVMASIALVLVGLLAAAATRRLHDGGRSGWWATLPLPFLAFGFIGMSFLRRTASGGDFPSAMFSILAINNIIYMLSLVTLVIFLAWTSEPRDNRFGPQQNPGN